MTMTTLSFASNFRRRTAGAFCALAGLASLAAFAPAALAANDPDAWLSAAANGETPKEKPHVEVSLISEKTALTPQADNRLGIVFKHEPGWHTYWKNPGEAGLANEFAFTLPPGFKASEPAYPIPERMVIAGITSFGYEGETIFPFAVDIPRRAGTGGSATIRLHVEYLACKDMCVPQSADVQLSLPLRVSGTLSSDAERLQEAIGMVPEKIEATDLVSAAIDETRLRITADAGALIKKSLDFFPTERGVVQYNIAPRCVMNDGSAEDGKAKASLYMTVTDDFAQAAPSAISGVVIADGGPKAGGWAIETTIPLASGTVTVPADAAVPATATASDAPAAAAGIEPEPVRIENGVAFTTWTALAFAILGGLILNLMPCVFPVLSLKLLQLVGGSQKGERLLMHGIAFTAGAVAAMGVLSGILIALRSAGGALGWGFQLQSPWVVGILFILFAAITMNLLGLYEFTFGSRIADAGIVRNLPQSRLANSFFTGVLAVVVASPCTAPFMGAALGYALTQPALEAIAVFLSLGLGMSMPWLLLCVFPAWTKKIPKPGPWMGAFRKWMALPMAAAVIWLGWVLSKQIDFFGMLLIACGLAACFIFFWLLGRAQWGKPSNRIVMGCMGAIVVLTVLFAGTERFARMGGAAVAEGWSAWSEDAVAAALSKGRPVFVDFTAAWCVTCQANKVAALDRDEVEARFAELGYVKLMGDWTNRDPAITGILETFGRSGVPLYLIYRPDGRVEVLPELLTPAIVVEALERK